MKYIIIIAFVLTFVCIEHAGATPEFAAWTGNKCSTCHISESGGGARNDFGYNFARDASLITPDNISFLKNNKIGNQIWNKRITFGTDFRFQSFRSHKTDDAKRKYYPMECALYLAFKPIEQISIEAQHNVGRQIFDGQKQWNASVKYSPAENLPYIRAGYFLPPIALRNPDMTDLDKRVAGPDGSITLIAPDFADWGVEIGYNSLDWLSIQAGIFNNKSIKEVSVLGDNGSINPNNAKLAASRIIIRPSVIFDIPCDFYFGYSNFWLGYLFYNSAFMSISPTENLVAKFQFAHSNRYSSRKTFGYIADATYMLMRGIFLTAKWQYGIADILWDKSTSEYLMTSKVHQWTFGAKFLPMPHVEFIPEYRYMKTTEYKSWRWMFQLHLYY